ncbi:hypothetical protein [Chthoniobacter flavus]|uniref:hypothetical protein n=1 Tax=Chthoniobacter flavus TaxID=191863 RepID=UPI0005B2E9E2|nr:hypothetical protein [Chthoniobacter flavus]
MLESGGHEMRYGLNGHPSPGEFRHTLLEGEHPLVDAHERRSQAAVVGIEYGGGFRHACRAASTQTSRILKA